MIYIGPGWIKLIIRYLMRLGGEQGFRAFGRRTLVLCMMFTLISYLFFWAKSSGSFISLWDSFTFDQLAWTISIPILCIFVLLLLWLNFPVFYLSFPMIFGILLFLVPYNLDAIRWNPFIETSFLCKISGLFIAGSFPITIALLAPGAAPDLMTPLGGFAYHGSKKHLNGFYDLTKSRDLHMSETKSSMYRIRAGGDWNTRWIALESTFVFSYIQTYYQFSINKSTLNHNFSLYFEKPSNIFARTFIQGKIRKPPTNIPSIALYIPNNHKIAAYVWNKSDPEMAQLIVGSLQGNINTHGILLLPGSKIVTSPNSIYFERRTLFGVQETAEELQDLIEWMESLAIILETSGSLPVIHNATI